MASFPRPAAQVVYFEPRTWQPRAWLLVTIAGALVGLLIGWAITFFFARGPLASQEWHVSRWQAETIPGTVFNFIGIGGDPSPAEAEEAIARYFALTTEIRGALDAPVVDYDRVDALVADRAQYENDVEAHIEGLVDDAVQEAGLQRAVPLFADLTQTWPPVNLELTNPPRLLVRSPRDGIVRSGDTLLDPNITFAETLEMEDATDDADTVSLVVPIGGLAAYPAVVSSERSYDSFLDTAAHEWIHHYLAFYPLGEEWGRGGDAHVMNETVANIAGRELANIVRTEHPIVLAPGADGHAPPRPEAAQPTVDFQAEMRRLRVEVDGLLAEGKVAEAEAMMEERRQYLEDNGIYLRKINQAYFAFYGTYGDSAAAAPTGPGPKVERVWELTQDVRLFLEVMRDVRTVADLDRAVFVLTEAAAGATP